MQLKDESLEFESEPQDEVGFPHPPGRNQFRYQVNNYADFFVDFQSRCYPLVDLSEGGVSISIAARRAISLDGFISHCNLVLGDIVLTGLEGRVVHYSLGHTGSWHCGIEWLNLKPTDSEWLAFILINLRKELFDHE